MYHPSKAISKLQVWYFKSYLFINGLLSLPAQTRQEIEIFKRIFDTLTVEDKWRVFEWGSGFSTIFYPSYLTKRSLLCVWHSVDNNKNWHKKIRSKIGGKEIESYVKLNLKPFPSFWEKPGWGPVPPPCGAFSPKSENERAYIDFPKTFDHKFHIVIVDGRFRRYCLQVAREVVMTQGIVIMHDAQKAHYHFGINGFRYNKFITSGSWFPFQQEKNKMWVGSPENSSIISAAGFF
jgi:hypothetical protein